MPNRNFTYENYRFGFNGQENDNEMKGEGNQIDFKFRGYDPRLARFTAVDPLNKSFPELSTYQFASNTPIWAKELEGLEANYTNEGSVKSEGAGPTNAVSGPISENYATDLSYTSYGVIDNQFTDIGVGDQLVDNISRMTDKELNCGGICYELSKNRVDQAFQDVRGSGLPTTDEFKRQWNVAGRDNNAATGSAGALRDAGLGDFKNRDQVIGGELRPGAALQVWTHRTIQESVENGGYGHSVIFLNYTYDQLGKIAGMNVADQGFKNGMEIPFEAYRGISGANLGELRRIVLRLPR